MDDLKRLQLKAGKILIKENDMTRKLFILRKGKVRVFKQYMGGKITLAILTPGEIFGELSFFDSKPRSASVEAVTDIIVDCIDGEELNSEIESLPGWVHLIFQSVSARFREIDQKMAVLQSLSNFQRKTLTTDSVGNTIYTDLLRMIKILKMIIHDKKEHLKKDQLAKELEQTVGSTHISTKAFLSILLDYDFVSHSAYQDHFIYKVYEDKVDLFEKFLKEQ